MEPSTLDLLEHLVTHPQVRHALLIGAYWDNEVSPTHPLLWPLEAIRNAGARSEEIVLAPFRFDGVGWLVADAVHCASEHAWRLARLVREKNRGNPFFAIQFLTALAEEGLLRFHPLTRALQRDMQRIHAKSYTDNVVDLMTGKLNRFSANTQEAMKQLVYPGYTAGVATLALVLGERKEAMHTALLGAVRAGLVFHRRTVTYFCTTEPSRRVLSNSRRAGDLSQHQQVLVGKRRGIVFGPLTKLFSMHHSQFPPPRLFVGRSVFIERRHRQSV
jgi:predicted ATPase